ncbi:hypothetical protein KR222_009592 [Zaprionus bogoriensis]|nr:hypothetical protein KR222_009592 [Zaprionus bogoriensis]
MNSATAGSGGGSSSSSDSDSGRGRGSSMTMTTTPNLYDEKEVMEEFISCYRHFRALWDNGSMDYLSKKKKEPGYQELLKILKRVNHDASVQDVKRKINSLRCCYRREIKKIQMSYDSYEPRLWWFHMMDFLKPVLNLSLSTTPTLTTTTTTTTSTSTPMLASTSTPLSRVKHSGSLDDSLDEASMHDEEIFAEPFQPEEDMLVIEGDGEVETEVLGDVDAEGLAETEPELEAEPQHQLRRLKIEHKYQPHSSAVNSSSSGNNNINSSSSSKYSHSHSHPHPYGAHQMQQQQQLQQQQPQQLQMRRSAALRRQRQRSSDFDGDADADADVDYDVDAGSSKKRRHLLMLEQRSAEHAESECDLIGKRMAAHFRNMRPDQRLFAERIISEVLVYGRMNRLSLDARFLPNGSADMLGHEEVVYGRGGGVRDEGK